MTGKNATVRGLALAAVGKCNHVHFLVFAFMLEVVK